jgi:hypothetical protein
MFRPKHLFIWFVLRFTRLLMIFDHTSKEINFYQVLEGGNVKYSPVLRQIVLYHCVVIFVKLGTKDIDCLSCKKTELLVLWWTQKQMVNHKEITRLKKWMYRCYFLLDDESGLTNDSRSMYRCAELRKLTGCHVYTDTFHLYNYFIILNLFQDQYF